MNQKMLFFVTLNWTYFVFSSDRSLPNPTPIKINDTLPFLKVKRIDQNYTDYPSLIIYCARMHPEIPSLGSLNFIQKEDGTLYAICRTKDKDLRQKLGNFSQEKINVDDVVIEWPGINDIEIKFPCLAIAERNSHP